MCIFDDRSNESSRRADGDGHVDLAVLPNERLHPETVRLCHPQTSKGWGLEYRSIVFESIGLDIL